MFGKRLVNFIDKITVMLLSIWDDKLCVLIVKYLMCNRECQMLNRSTCLANN